MSSGAAIVVEPLRGVGERNLLCEPAPRPPGEAIENPRSTGIHLRFGQFRFVDLGDLSGQPLYSLFCPVNLLGPVDVISFRITAGADTASLDAFTMRPRVAIANNGATKADRQRLCQHSTRPSPRRSWRRLAGRQVQQRRREELSRRADREPRRHDQPLDQDPRERRRHVHRHQRPNGSHQDLPAKIT